MILWKAFSTEPRLQQAPNHRCYWLRFFSKQATTITLAAMLCIMIIICAPSMKAFASNIEEQLETIYHVYVNGERVGSINDRANFHDLVEEKIETTRAEYENIDNLVIGQDVELIPERVFTPHAKTTETLEKLEQILSVKVEAIALEVNDGEDVLYLEETETAEDVLKALTLQYVPKERYETYFANKKDEEDEEKVEISSLPKVGEREIATIRFSVPVNVETEKVAPEEVLSVEQAVQKLNKGVLTDDVYYVEPGDVLGSIAKKYNLTLEEILSLNPDITEDTLLQIGQEIKVQVYKPVLKVLVEEMATIKEEIPFQTETREDSSMWKGDTKVIQEGQRGKKVVTYELLKENGQELQRTIVEEEVLAEPVSRIIVKGTKESPSRGTGKLSWPTVGGYISSYQGMRWGRLHRGIDIARPSSYEILAADNGTVTFVGYNGGYGNMVKIDHNNGIETLYAHLKSIDVSEGDVIGKGQKIGIMGSTGHSTGTHLHFEVYKNGKLENPINYLN